MIRFYFVKDHPLRKYFSLRPAPF